MDETNELLSFLKNAKAAVTTHTSTSKKFHVVIGNESADLDSFVSAIVYAFYLSKKNDDDDLLYIPIVSIHSDDLVLRTEIIALLDKLGLSQSDVIHLNDVNFVMLTVRKVTLVDHNNNAKHLKDLRDFVCHIVDHHEDGEDFTDDNMVKNIKTVGSCATLITEEIYYSSYKPILSTYPVSELLLSAILIDTYNLNLHSGRTTELDIFMGEILTNYTKEESEQFFNYLQKAKTDISSMTTFDILRKDYKPVSTSCLLKMGISSVTMDSMGLLPRDDFERVSDEYMSKVQIDVLVIMFLSFKDNTTLPYREIAIFTKEPAYQEAVCSYLLSSQELKLCERSYVKLRGFVRLFDQEPKLSRKFVLPILQKLHRKEN